MSLGSGRNDSLLNVHLNPVKYTLYKCKSECFLVNQESLISKSVLGLWVLCISEYLAHSKHFCMYIV